MGFFKPTWSKVGFTIISFVFLLGLELIILFSPYCLASLGAESPIFPCQYLFYFDLETFQSLISDLIFQSFVLAFAYFFSCTIVFFAHKLKKQQRSMKRKPARG